MAVLVVAEHDNRTVRKATLNAVAAAQKLGSDIHVLVAGHQASVHPDLEVGHVGLLVDVRAWCAVGEFYYRTGRRRALT